MPKPEAASSKKVTPPYATPAGIHLFFEKIKTVKPATLTTKWAEDHDLPFADAIVNTMKFLGAVAKDGSLSPDFPRLRLEGEPFQETLSKLVATAYSPIFDQVDDIRNISEANLNNAFKSAYDVGSPGRYVRPFLTLCELAGLRDADPAATAPSRSTKREAPRRTPTKPKPAVRTLPKSTGGSPMNPVLPIQIVLRLDIPWDATVEEINARVRALSSLGVTSEE